MARAIWGPFWTQFKSKFGVLPKLSSNLTMQTDQCKNLHTKYVWHKNVQNDQHFRPPPRRVRRQRWIGPACRQTLHWLR
jgi:hypothetical protein